MREDPERNQLDLWEKLNRLYGDKDPAPDGQAANADKLSGNAVPPQAIDPVASGNDSVEQVQTGQCPESVPKVPVERVIAPVPPRRAGGGYRSPSRELGRVNEICSRCRRSCKQTGQKLNRMLCIGFLPLED